MRAHVIQASVHACSCERVLRFRACLCARVPCTHERVRVPRVRVRVCARVNVCESGWEWCAAAATGSVCGRLRASLRGSLVKSRIGHEKTWGGSLHDRAHARSPGRCPHFAMPRRSCGRGPAPAAAERDSSPSSSSDDHGARAMPLRPVGGPFGSVGACEIR